MTRQVAIGALVGFTITILAVMFWPQTAQQQGQVEMLQVGSLQLAPIPEPHGIALPGTTAPKPVGPPQQLRMVAPETMARPIPQEVIDASRARRNK
jgi:hypothetical protein